MATKTKMTVEEYLLLPEREDGRRTELIDGEVVVTPQPSVSHGGHHVLLIWALVDWYRKAPGRARISAPIDVTLAPDDVFAPDIVIFEPDATVNERGRLEDLPLICVEIRSPSTWRYDIGRKKSMYEANGLPELWLVDGFGHVVLVFRRSRSNSPVFDVSHELARDDALTSPLLPGFALSLAELFGPDESDRSA